MVRTYKRKTDRKTTSPKKLEASVHLLKKGWTIRKVASYTGINRQTLFRVYSKLKKNPDYAESFNLSYQSRCIFTKEMEDNIAQYCIHVAQMGYGLTVNMVRELAWQVAVENNISIPENWQKECKAGIDWFHGFKKRHPIISIRVPEACSIARAMAFNKTNVKIFFDKLKEVLLRNDSFRNGSRIYNLDETATSTVQNQRKILSPKGVKQVHKIKGAERGISVTTCVIIGAFGVILPPVLIFPRKKRIPDLMIDAFPGSLGLGNEKGYMTKESFLCVMEHFIKYTKSSKQNPTLLLLDNVETHFSIKTLDLAKENGVVVFTFPPHCTHRLQPLDVGIFGPFKIYYDNAINSYLINNPASPPTLYRIAGFVKEALCKAATPNNIIKSFEKTGIFPFNRDVFEEADFIMASVTEKPDPSKTDPISSSEIMIPADIIEERTDMNECGPGTVSERPSTSSSDKPSFRGPIDIRGLPKAKQQENKRRNKRKGRCMIATDTPEKKEIAEREKERELKKNKTEERKIKRQERKEVGIKRKQKEKKKIIVQRINDISEEVPPNLDSLPPLTHLPKKESSF